MVEVTVLSIKTYFVDQKGEDLNVLQRICV